MKKYIYIILIVAFGFTACKPEFSNPISDSDYSAGDADFSKYVAVGNSLTAGYTNGTLYKSGQEMSFPNILAKQMKLTGGGDFTQPYLDDDTNDVGGLVIGSNVISHPKFIINASQGGVEPINKIPTIDISNIHPGPYNNMGVPGAKIFHLAYPGYGNLSNFPASANPYFIRMASAPNETVIHDAVAQNPSFFTLWIGNNDVLWFATSGGTGTDQTGNTNPSTYGPNDITDPGVFAYLYQQLLDALTANGAKGVVATIPDVASVPFFTTIPYNPIPLDNQNTVDALNNAYTQYNTGVQQALAASLISQDEADARTISFSIGANAMVIEDEYLTDLSGLGLPSFRQTTDEDLVVLTAKSIIGQPDPNNNQFIYGLTKALEDKWILSKDEITLVRNATTAYNNAITQLAASKDLAVADMAAVMQKFHNHLVAEDGSVYTADYFNGTNLDQLAFGLDGVHPNPRGYAIIANEFIKVINNKYHSNLPLVNQAYYPTITILGSN